MGPDKTTQTSSPWKPAQAGLKNVIGNAGTLFNSGQSFVAPQSDYTTQANSMLAGLAGSGPSTVDTSGLKGMLHQGTSPQFSAMLDTQAEKLGTDISRQFGSLGRGGSVAHQNALTEGVGNLRTSAMAGELARQQGVNLGVLGQIANIDQANLGNQYAPAEALSQIGAREDARAQADNPWTRLNQYAGLMGGLGGMGGTTTQTQSGGLGAFGDIAGLGLTGLQLASGIPSGFMGGLFGGGGSAPTSMAQPWQYGR